MKKFIITKEVEAENITDALKKEKSSPVQSIAENTSNNESTIGFKCS